MISNQVSLLKIKQAIYTINAKAMSRGWLDSMSDLWSEDEGGGSLSSLRCTQRISIYNATSEVANPTPLRESD